MQEKDRIGAPDARKGGMPFQSIARTLTPGKVSALQSRGSSLQASKSSIIVAAAASKNALGGAGIPNAAFKDFESLKEHLAANAMKNRQTTTSSKQPLTKNNQKIVSRNVGNQQHAVTAAVSAPLSNNSLVKKNSLKARKLIISSQKATQVAPVIQPVNKEQVRSTSNEATPSKTKSIKSNIAVAGTQSNIIAGKQGLQGVIVASKNVPQKQPVGQKDLPYQEQDKFLKKGVLLRALTNESSQESISAETADNRDDQQPYQTLKRDSEPKGSVKKSIEPTESGVGAQNKVAATQMQQQFQLSPRKTSSSLQTLLKSTNVKYHQNASEEEYFQKRAALELYTDDDSKLNQRSHLLLQEEGRYVDNENSDYYYSNIHETQETQMLSTPTQNPPETQFQNKGGYVPKVNIRQSAIGRIPSTLAEANPSITKHQQIVTAQERKNFKPSQKEKMKKSGESSPSAYNDTFMPKKLNGAFPKQTTVKKKVLMQSNSEAVLHPMLKKPTKTGANSSRKENSQVSQNSTLRKAIQNTGNLDFLEVMKSFNLPALQNNSSQSAKISTRNANSQESAARVPWSMPQSRLATLHSVEQLPLIIDQARSKDSSLEPQQEQMDSADLNNYRMTPINQKSQQQLRRLIPLKANNSNTPELLPVQNESLWQQQQSKVYTPFDEFLRSTKQGPRTSLPGKKKKSHYSRNNPHASNKAAQPQKELSAQSQQPSSLQPYPSIYSGGAIVNVNQALELQALSAAASQAYQRVNGQQQESCRISAGQTKTQVDSMHQSSLTLKEDSQNSHRVTAGAVQNTLKQLQSSTQQQLFSRVQISQQHTVDDPSKLTATIITAQKPTILNSQNSAALFKLNQTNQTVSASSTTNCGAARRGLGGQSSGKNFDQSGGGHRYFEPQAAPNTVQRFKTRRKPNAYRGQKEDTNRNFKLRGVAEELIRQKEQQNAQSSNSPKAQQEIAQSSVYINVSVGNNRETQIQSSKFEIAGKSPKAKPTRKHLKQLHTSSQEPQTTEAMQAEAQRHGRDFKAYLQEQILKGDQEAKKSIRAEEQRQKAKIQKDLFASSSVELLQDKKIVILDKSHSQGSIQRTKTDETRIENAAKQTESPDTSPPQAAATASLANKNMQNSSNAGNVFALRSRPDSPLRTLFGIGRSKDFKVLNTHLQNLNEKDGDSFLGSNELLGGESNDILANFEAIDGISDEIKLESLKQLILESQASKVPGMVALNEHLQRMTTNTVKQTSKSPAGAHLQPSNWQRLIMKINQAAKMGVWKPEPDTTQGKPRKQQKLPQLQHQSIEAKSTRLSQLVVQPKVPSPATRQVNQATTIQLTGGGNEELGMNPSNSKLSRQRGRNYHQTEHPTAFQEHFKFNNEISIGQGSVSGSDSGQASPHEISSINIETRYGFSGEHTLKKSQAAPPQKRSLPELVGDQKLQKSMQENQHPQLTDGKQPEMLLQEDGDGTDLLRSAAEKNSANKNWRQLPIKEHDSATLSIASSKSRASQEGSSHKTRKLKSLKPHKAQIKSKKASPQNTSRGSSVIDTFGTQNNRFATHKSNHVTSHVTSKLEGHQVQPQAAQIPFSSLVESKKLQSGGEEMHYDSSRRSRNTVFMRRSTSQEEESKLVPQDVVGKNSSSVISASRKDKCFPGKKIIHSSASRSPVSVTSGATPTNDREKPVSLKATSRIDLDPRKPRFATSDRVSTEGQEETPHHQEAAADSVGFNSKSKRIQQIANDTVPASLYKRLSTEGNQVAYNSVLATKHEPTSSRNASSKWITSVMPNSMDSALKKKGSNKFKFSPRFGGSSTAKKLDDSRSKRREGKGKSGRRLKQSRLLQKHKSSPLKKNLSGWSTGRNSNKTEVELFENAVLVKNMSQSALVTANDVKAAKVQDGPKAEQDQDQMKKNKNTDLLVQSNQEIVNASMIGKVTIRQKASSNSQQQSEIQPKTTTLQQKKIKLQGGDKPLSFIKRAGQSSNHRYKETVPDSSSVNQPRLQYEEKQHINTSLNKRQVVVASVCNMSQPSMHSNRMQQNQQQSQRTSSDHPLQMQAQYSPDKKTTLNKSTISLSHRTNAHPDGLVFKEPNNCKMLKKQPMPKQQVTLTQKEYKLDLGGDEQLFASNSHFQQQLDYQQASAYMGGLKSPVAAAIGVKSQNDVVKSVTAGGKATDLRNRSIAEQRMHSKPMPKRASSNTDSYGGDGASQNSPSQKAIANFQYFSKVMDLKSRAEEKSNKNEQMSEPGSSDHSPTLPQGGRCSSSQNHQHPVTVTSMMSKKRESVFNKLPPAMQSYPVGGAGLTNVKWVKSSNTPKSSQSSQRQQHQFMCLDYQTRSYHKEQADRQSQSQLSYLPPMINSLGSGSRNGSQLHGQMISSSDRGFTVTERSMGNGTSAIIVKQQKNMFGVQKQSSIDSRLSQHRSQQEAV